MAAFSISSSTLVSVTSGEDLCEAEKDAFLTKQGTAKSEQKEDLLTVLH